MICVNVGVKLLVVKEGAAGGLLLCGWAALAGVEKEKGAESAPFSLEGEAQNL
ncbi:hypothetical protein [Azotobacter salinestris]|uniref:hypothetical protein n=1 Tax=Azotobacter salinestris TaxID=69964 RepID=UPI00142EA2C1|nr:hypothetical protein [Azotobacter salinestris]